MGFGNWLKTIGEQIDAPPVLTLGLEAPSPLPAPVPKSHRGRSFEGAKYDRLTLGWGTSITGLDQELRGSLRALRARSRWLDRNDPSVRKYLQLVEDNIAGADGFKLQVRALKRDGKPDNDLNTRIETLWLEWGLCEHASASGLLSWADLQRLFIRTTARDGEALFRKVPLPHAFGFGLQPIPVEYLDEAFNGKLQNGNRVIMSVETDQYGKPVAYHLRPSDADRMYRYVGGDRIRVPASEIIHFFLPESCDQTRGVPWLASAFTSLKMLDGYVDAVLTTARAGACQSGVLKKHYPADYNPHDGDDEDDESGLMTIPMQPGVFTEIPDGYDLEPFNPDQPTEVFAPFVQAILRRVSTAGGVAAHSLTADMTQVNYTSSRTALLDERVMWRGKQRQVVDRLCRPVYRDFLTYLLLTGRVTPDEFERARDPLFRARGWDWVDPQKDATAGILQIDAGLLTRTDYCAQKGEDYEDVLDQLKAEQELAHAKGVILPTAGATTLLMLQMLQQASKDKENG